MGVQYRDGAECPVTILRTDLVVDSIGDHECLVGVELEYFRAVVSDEKKTALGVSTD